MKLYCEILQNALGEQAASRNPKSLVCETYKALQAIRAVLDDHTLDDPACFARIEEIVAIFEQLGSNGGSRHDF